MPARLGSGYRWLLASSWTTNLGDGVAVAAGPLLIASLTDDPFLVSLAALLRWAPPLMFSLYAGVLSDRLDRRRIMVVANAFRAAVLTLLVVMLITGSVSVIGALVALGLLATAEVFADDTAATFLVSKVVLPAHGHGAADGPRSLWRDIAEAFRWTVRSSMSRSARPGRSSSSMPSSDSAWALSGSAFSRRSRPSAAWSARHSMAGSPGG